MHSCRKNESMNLGSKARNGNSCNTHSGNDGQNDKGKLMLFDALQRHDGWKTRASRDELWPASIVLSIGLYITQCRKIVVKKMCFICGTNTAWFWALQVLKPCHALASINFIRHVHLTKRLRIMCDKHLFQKAPYKKF